MRKIYSVFQFPQGTNCYLHRGDCVAYMKTMPSKCVDSIITDIPYGEVNAKVKGNTRLDVGFADEVNFDLREVIENFIRISTNNIVVFCGVQQISEITRIMEEYGLRTRLMTWYKPDGRPHNAQHTMCSSAEFCVIGRFPKATFRGYNIRNVLTYNVCRNSKNEKRCHATQKPRVMMRDLIQIFTNEGDTVFDPFMGSGTTGDAAISLGRKFIGCELCDKYFDFAQERIENTVLDMPEVFCDGRYQEKKPINKPTDTIVETAPVVESIERIELDKIYNEDCLEGMKRIPDNSVDAVICDLPYEVLNKGNNNAKWDKQLPMGKLWEQYLRICKPSAPIILFGQGMFTANVMASKPDLWRYNLIWDKSRTTGFLNAQKQPLRCHEDIMVFYQEAPTYHPQLVDLKEGEKKHSQGNGEHKLTNRCYGQLRTIKASELTEGVKDKKYSRSIICIPKEHNREQFHPTQKPVDLIRYLIRTYTNEGATVLDNCMGSGTTAIAAIREGRHFIGFETNEEYYSRSVERVQKELDQRKKTTFRNIEHFLTNYNRLLALCSVNREATTTPGAQARRVACIPGVRTLSPLCICTVSFQTVDLPHIGNWDFAERDIPASVLYLANDRLHPYPNGPPLLPIFYGYNLT